MLLGTLTLLSELDPSKTWPDIVMLIKLPYNNADQQHAAEAITERGSKGTL